ncbi:MAG: GAF domain-containing sensor histidine kinase, partial [Microcystaceae cyanobacterium]
MQYPLKSYELGQKIIRSIRTSPNPQALLLEIALTLGTEFKVDACLIVAGINSPETLQTAFWNGNQSSILPAEISDSLVANFLDKEMVAENPSWEIADLEEAANPASVRWLGEVVSVRSLLGTATHFQGNVNGILILGYGNPHGWSTEEQELLQGIAESVAIACSMVHKVNLPVANYSRPLPVDGSPLFRRWYELTRQQLEQQRQLNELKNEIITTISDKARNPLASMKMVIEMLSGSSSEKLPVESQERYWTILKQAWHSLNDLITDIVTLQKLGSQELTFNPETVSLIPLIHELSRSFQEQWQDDKRKRLTLVVNESPII